jgi:hypothetical protein
MYRECTAVLEPFGCQPAPSLASSAGQAGGHDTKEPEIRAHGREGRSLGSGFWEIDTAYLENHTYAKVRPKVRDRFACRADRSELYHAKAHRNGRTT